MKRETIFKKPYIILDGAMGTVLQKNGLAPGDIPEFLNITNPQLITQVHKSYVESGSDILYTNTFGVNRMKLAEYDYTVEQLVSAAVFNAREAAKGSDTLVALDVGPLGKMLEPSGDLPFETAYDCFKELMVAGERAGADFIVVETMTDLQESRAALLAAKENTALPVLCTMSFEENMRTFTGVDITAMALVLEGLGANAIGINCSLGPRQLYPLAEKLVQSTTLPVVLKPNAGLPDPNTGGYDLSPEEFANCMVQLHSLGIQFLGGCCGTTPDYIQALVSALASAPKAEKRRLPVLPARICSPSKVVDINCPRIIGERINPTGKKLFKEALRNGDINYILNQGLSQVAAGAEILDVNVGLPEINETEMMTTVVKALQGVVDVPLQIDSTNPEVLESALRIYNGKPIVNSVNGEEESLNRILPLVKKYGAAVVCLTLDDTGIPKKAEKRFEIAERILKKALALGIPKQDIYIDCLTLTASAEQAAVMETIKAVQMVKEQLGLKTVLGVSNISFGLPNRELVNQTFLSMALSHGLDLPILNPNIELMTGTVRAYRLLTNVDKNAEEYIQQYGNESGKASAVKQEEKPSDPGSELVYSITKGLAEDGARLTGQLLTTMSPMDIVDQYLIPALDDTGKKFETGRIFLPQLILSANAAQSCFSVIREHLISTDAAPVSKGKIILATVKGDIHDIGKNIVKVLLENYGYEVIDLGRDVDPQSILDTAIEQKVTLIGLSALMTTTLKSMEDTITLLQEHQVPCEVMVGGAVLTPEYAEKINADYYAKDAKEAVDVAKRHFDKE